MLLESEKREDAIPAQPISQMAGLIFDDRPAALRGSLQVFVAVLIGVMMANTLNLMV